MGVCAVWCLASILALNIGCSSAEVARTGTGKCSGLVSFLAQFVTTHLILPQVTRWGVIGAFDALTEIMIYGISVAVVFPLQMSFQMKFQASACFIFRLPYSCSQA